MSDRYSSESRIRERVAGLLVRKRMEEGWKDGKHVSQSEMSKRFGISQGSLSQYERGTRLPEGDNMHRIAAYIGVEFYDACEVPRSIPNEPTLLEVIENWAWLPKDFRKKFANLVRDEAEAQKERSSPKGLVKKEVATTK